MKIGAIYALYPESFCDKNLAIRKVFAFCDSALDHDQNTPPPPKKKKKTREHSCILSVFFKSRVRFFYDNTSTVILVFRKDMLCERSFTKLLVLLAVSQNSDKQDSKHK